MPRPAVAIGNQGFRWQTAGAAEVLVSEPLLAVAPHCFTTRALGAGRADDELLAAHGAIAAYLGVAPGALRSARQVHGAALFVADGHAPIVPPEADVLLASEPTTAVVVQTADCAPVLIGDARTGAVAAVHAGWRGTCAGVVMAAVRALAARFGSAPADLVVAIGPSIGACCYQVGADVHQAFLSRKDLPDAASWFSPDGDRWRLDIWRANHDQLRLAGVPEGAIHVAGHCTASMPDRYHSYRLEGACAGRQFAAIRPPAR